MLSSRHPSVQREVARLGWTGDAVPPERARRASHPDFGGRPDSLVACTSARLNSRLVGAASLMMTALRSEYPKIAFQPCAEGETPWLCAGVANEVSEQKSRQRRHGGVRHSLTNSNGRQSSLDADRDCTPRLTGMPSPVSINIENFRYEFVLSSTPELVHEGGIDVGFSEREVRVDVGSFREVDDARDGRQDLTK